jgi:hypothetical protein
VVPPSDLAWVNMPCRFEVVGYDAIEFYGAGGVPIMDRDNVAQITVLRDKAALTVHGSAETAKRNRSELSDSEVKAPRVSHHVVVVNVHLLFNTKRGDVKMCQLHHLMHRAHEAAADIKGWCVVC